MRLALLIPLLLSSTLMAQPATTQTSMRYVGGDVSMLPSLERFGATYADAAGKPGDAIAALRGVGWSTFRVRLFVDPSRDFDKTWGATQSLTDVRALAKRIQGAGGEVMLDIHYSDTWADPEHQAKPKAWADLHGEALERRVHDYTVDVLKALKGDGVTPAIVQVGNEITAGLLWPDGRVEGKTPAERAERSAEFVRLIAAGCRGVREASPSSRTLIHAHGGGKLDLAFFYDLLRGVDYDLIGLSFYPVYGESLDRLAKQIGTLRVRYGKDVLVAETSYPHRPIEIAAKYRPFLTWPTTAEGQATFARALRDAVSSAGGVGIVWWYPEATRVAGHAVYHDGAEGVFDDAARLPLPAARNLVP